MTFRLEKAYVDVLDDGGNWWIGYDASLAWGPAHLGYREVFAENFSRRSTTIGSRGGTSGRVHLPGASLELLSGSAPRPTLSFKNSVLEWRLTHVRGDVLLNVDGAERIISGAGYGEIVVLQAPPWRLGIEQLRWGRYISATHFATWIVATGPQPISFGVIDDGVVTATAVQENVLHLGDHRIELGGIVRPIAAGDPLDQRSWPIRRLARRLAPAFALAQHKAVYNTVMTAADGSSEVGMAIAEQVTFSRRPRTASRSEEL